MLTSSKTQTTVPIHAEHVHDNTARICGVITKLWLQDRNVLCRLKSMVEDQPSYLTLFFPDGQPLSGPPISLAPGLRLIVNGYLRDVEYRESFAQVLDAGGWPKLIQPGDETILIKQTTTQLVVESCEPASPDGDDINEARLSGIVAKVWRRPGKDESDVFASLAIYDEHAAITGLGRKGLPRRKAHYVRLIFPRGLTADGFKVDSHLAKRVVLITGPVCSLDYRDRLDWLLERSTRANRPIDEDAAHLRVNHSLTRVLGNRIIVLSGNPGRD